MLISTLGGETSQGWSTHFLKPKRLDGQAKRPDKESEK